MKKTISTLLIAMLLVSCFSLAGAEETPEGSRMLVVSFSRVGNAAFADDVDIATSASLQMVDGVLTGNNQLLAAYAQQALGADHFEIHAEETYPSDYRENTEVATVEKAENARPALATQAENMDAYDTIILISPIWWATMPMPVFTFLESYDFAGKTIAAIISHEGSGLGSSISDIQTLCPDATLLEGLAVRGSSASDAQDTVTSWLTQIGLMP